MVHQHTNQVVQNMHYYKLNDLIKNYLLDVIECTSIIKYCVKSDNLLDSIKSTVVGEFSKKHLCIL